MKVNQDYIEWEVLRKILEKHQWVFMERCPYAYYSLCDDIYNNVKTSLQDVLLKELVKNCEKLRSQGDGCFSCKYSSDGFLHDCRIGEPWNWDLEDEEQEIYEEVDDGKR